MKVKTATNAPSPAVSSDPPKIEREQGLELVARCLVERLGADVASISVRGDQGLGQILVRTGPGAPPLDGDSLTRRVPASEGAVVERFPERGGPGGPVCTVAAPIRMPQGVAGTVCALAVADAG